MDYFTPSIEDFRIGYQCERFHGVPGGEDFWEPLVIREIAHITEVLLQSRQIRVPYLTKEQIEAEGWDFIEHDRVLDILEFKKKDGNYWYELSFYQGVNTIIIEYWRHQDDDQQLFNGKCKDINTFRYICKLLGI